MSLLNLQLTLEGNPKEAQPKHPDSNPKNYVFMSSDTEREKWQKDINRLPETY